MDRRSSLIIPIAGIYTMLQCKIASHRASRTDADFMVTVGCCKISKHRSLWKIKETQGTIGYSGFSLGIIRYNCRAYADRACLYNSLIRHSLLRILWISEQYASTMYNYAMDYLAIFGDIMGCLLDVLYPSEPRRWRPIAAFFAVRWTDAILKLWYVRTPG